jgi:hypothetical protein
VLQQLDKQKTVIRFHHENELLPSITTFSVTTLSIAIKKTTLSIMTHSVMTLILSVAMPLSAIYTEHGVCFIGMLSVVRLNVLMLAVIILSVMPPSTGMHGQGIPSEGEGSV